jgi:hypothetical protein
MPQEPQTTPDQAAAHQLLSELRTRISTQPLPYQYGVEARALESLWEVFAQARTAMKDHPGCDDFARITTRMLNLDLRPITAKWHRAYQEGRLNSRDGANAFRSDLIVTQGKLRAFADQLHQMAYNTPIEDDLTVAPMAEQELDQCFAPLPYGIAPSRLIDPATTEAINSQEKDSVRLRRAHYDLPADDFDAVGLGLSGGGIRSATFCLGVCQVLADRGLLKEVDFLSTVSGGGYTGSFLTTALTGPNSEATVALPHGPDPEPITRLRHRAKYMSAANLKAKWMMVTSTLAGLILNWSIPLFMVVLVALVASMVHVRSRFWAQACIVAGVASVISMLIYAFQVRYRAKSTSGGWLLGGSCAVSAAIALTWAITALYRPVSKLDWGFSGVVAAGLAALPIAIRFLPLLDKPIVRQIVLKVLVVLAGILVPLGAILLTFALFNLTRKDAPTWLLDLTILFLSKEQILLLFMALLLGMVAILLLNINLTSPHRLYRDQLAQTFLNGHDHRSLDLKDINPNGFAPYHLINSTLNLPSSQSLPLRDRKSDFFLFSKHWCGAPSVGYHPTKDWLAGKQAIDLATAMATSGAAASPHMGLGTIPSLTALLTFFNLRLGYWLRRPAVQNQSWLGRQLGRAKTPGFSCLIREMFGLAMSEKQTWINLSDGGHIENMGVYELLRRRCKFIISVDAEADSASAFPGHLTLVRHAQIDFGIRIDSGLNDLRPDATSRLSQAHSTLCRIHYPATNDQPAGIGLLLYLKASVTGDEVEMIRSYRSLHPDFPHQTTLDQFFDQEQFEAYRQLGIHSAEGLFAPAVAGSQRRPSSTRAWFEELAHNLLVPETH